MPTLFLKDCFWYVQQSEITSTFIDLLENFADGAKAA
jgi:hypothetical protein